MTKQIIAVDIDDVLSINVPAFLEFTNKEWGGNVTIDEFDENWAEMWGVDNEEVTRRRNSMDKKQLPLFYESIEGAHEVLLELAKDFKIIVATSRHDALIDMTHQWVDEHFPGVFSGIHFAGIWDVLDNDTAHLRTKADMLKELGAKYLIDDQPKHCLAAAEAGMESLLFGDYPWSRDTQSAKGVTRMHNWQEVKAYFDERQHR